MNAQKCEDPTSLSQPFSAGDFVKSKPYCAFNSKDTLFDIVTTMKEMHSYAALVTDENQDLLGLLAEHRILLYLLPPSPAQVPSAERVNKAFNVLKAEDVMIPYPATIDADMPVEESFNEITRRGFRYMPVVESNKRPVGILNRTEITQYMEEKNRQELESKDMILSYLMHHENYGCL